MNSFDFYSYRLIGKLTVFLHLQEFNLWRGRKSSGGGENPPGPGIGPGTVRQSKLGQGRKGRKGREGRKDGKERGRERTDLQRGKEWACGADDGWIDGHRREQDIDRREGGLGRRQNEKREGNERVAWTAVLAVCFIDHTW